MLLDRSDPASFDEFARRAEPRLREALSAALGSHVGRDAAAEALAFGWENWPKVVAMGNPVGYLFIVGRNRGRRLLRHQPVTLMTAQDVQLPWVEAGLPEALVELSEQQRTTVMLLHCFQWTYSEVAELMGVSKSTVQNHASRGISRLRSQLGVTV